MLGSLAQLVRGLLAAAVLGALLAGLPWALTHFVGWPLPNHLPTWAEIQGVLLGPMTTTFLLDSLACLTWLVWVFFALDVARCAIDIARDARAPDLFATGPVHRIAAVLVGAVLIALLGQRAGLPASPLHAVGPGSTDVVAAGPAWNQPSEQASTRVRPTAHTSPLRAAPGGADERPARATSAVVLPYDPETGVYDSLWRMAERALGDGTRWPEIYELNHGKPQPDGGTFTRPSLVFPGEELALPDDATVPGTPPHQPTSPSPTTATPPSTNPPTPASTPTRLPATTSQDSRVPATPPSSSTDAPAGPGFSWGEELFVGLGLVSVISAALVVVRRRNRRDYRPGSGDRSDLPVAPVVYQLRLAHLRADQGGHGPGRADDDLAHDRTGRREPVPPIVLGHDDHTPDDQAPVLPVGVRDGREIALSLATTRGLGLLGAGAAGAARALLLAALTTADEAATVLVPVEDLAVLAGRRAVQASLPAGLHVVPDLDAALDVLESETLVRAGQRRSTDRPSGPIVLVARTPGRQSRRLQAVLDNGAAVGVTGLLLGQWNSGVTAYVRDDGTISATSPGMGEPLRGTRVFRLGDDHTTDLLTLLHRAAPDDATETEHTADNPPLPVLPPRLHAGSDAFTVAPADSGEGGRHDEYPVAEEPADDELELPVARSGVKRRDARDLEIFATASTTSPGSRLRPDRPTRTRTEPRADHTSPVTSPGHSQDHRSGDVARPTQGVPFVPMRLSVLGPPQVWWRPESAGPDGDITEREISSAFQPRLRELLVFLALHPDGASREALISALWATSPPEKTTNAMNTSFSRLRRAVTAATEGALSDVLLAGEGRYRLDPGLVEVDYWSFAAAVTARRTAATDHQRVETYRRIVDTYRGPLADGISTDWIETAREAIRRDAIDAVAALARALVEHDPQQTLDLLEIARTFDPHNELIYRDIMRLQERLGRLDAIPRTLTLLTTRLAEVDDRPTPQAISLADRLRHRHDTTADVPHLSATDRRGHNRAG
ncbi:BTAD domain-containing putative transcriptional regulator [Actinosynnema sp. CA-299493]